MSQNFRLFHVSNLSVRNFRIFLLMYPGQSVLTVQTAAGRAVHAGWLNSAPLSGGSPRVVTVARVAAQRPSTAGSERCGCGHAAAGVQHARCDVIFILLSS